MQCENGYTKPGVRGILCRKCEEPKEGDLRSIAHALCGHQRFCPNARCYQFLPSWEKCTLRVNSLRPSATSLKKGGIGREEAAGEEMPANAGKPKGKKKAAKKSAESAERKGE